jgi:aminopeptidase N
LQDVSLALLVGGVGGKAWANSDVEALAAALEDTLTSNSLDPAFKALTLGIPTESVIARAIGSDIDPDKIRSTRLRLLGELVGHLRAPLLAVQKPPAAAVPFSPDARQSGERALRNTALALLVVGGTQEGPALASAQYAAATNMTDRFAALGAAVAGWTTDAQSMLGDFRTRYAGDPLVFDKWLVLNAVAPDPGVVDRIRAILADPTFPQNNPNRLRALMASFGMSNPNQFARSDGEGFRFLATFVGDLDKRNPQVASRVLTAFRVWRSYEPVRRAAAEAALKSLSDSGGLSRNTADILERTLAG